MKPGRRLSEISIFTERRASNVLYEAFHSMPFDYNEYSKALFPNILHSTSLLHMLL